MVDTLALPSGNRYEHTNSKENNKAYSQSRCETYIQ